MEGGAGADYFVFKNASDFVTGGTFDIISDFAVGEDKIYLHGLGLSMADVSSEQVGSDTVLHFDLDRDGQFDDGDVFLSHVTAANISASDFVF